jgi:hypothetical protein
MGANSMCQWYAPTPHTVEKLLSPKNHNNPKVYQYTFGQLNPFNAPFNGISNHALDLAYLHGDPRMFGDTANPEIEKSIDTAIKERWISFAYGEEPWDEKKILHVGPGKVTELNDETFLRGRKSENWKALDDLAVAERVDVTVILVTYLTKLSSVG